MLPDNRHSDFSLPPQEMSLTKASKKCHEAHQLSQPDSPQEQDRRKETAFIRLYGELAG
jgi:hypothetical protein